MNGARASSQARSAGPAHEAAVKRWTGVGVLVLGAALAVNQIPRVIIQRPFSMRSFISFVSVSRFQVGVPSGTRI